MSATKDKTSDEHTMAAEMGNENADPASTPGASAGAIPKSCADAVAEKTATMKKTAKALNELMFATADLSIIYITRERIERWFSRERRELLRRMRAEKRGGGFDTVGSKRDGLLRKKWV
ncbi:hypothetical protein CsSME_00011754 [Camellia sinensis var. sinensis]